MTLTKQRAAGVLITRSREGNEELAEKLRQAGLEPISVETISLAPPSDWKEVDGLLGGLGGFDWVVFTSPTGAKYFEARMNALSFSLSLQERPKVAAVGRKTAEALARAGLKVDFVPSVYTTAHLGRELPAGKGEKVLLLRADIADPALSKSLRERGVEIEEAAIYRTLPGRESSSRLSGADVVVFASPSAVRGLCSMVKEDELERLRSLTAVCIGPVTEAAARVNGFAKTVVPEDYTLDSVVSEVRRLSMGIA